MKLLAVTAVLLLSQSCYAANIEDFGSETVRALLREGAQPRPASSNDKRDALVRDESYRQKRVHSFLNSQSDDSELDFVRKLPEPSPEKALEDYLRAYDQINKRDFLRRISGNGILEMLENDASECKDNDPDCPNYFKDCWNPEKTDTMRDQCRKTCGHCRCWDRKSYIYGCCTNDIKIPAEGYNRKGCSKKLCVDFDDCQKKKSRCKVAVGKERANLENRCSFTCGYCNNRKAPSPQKKCESQVTQFGCCWDGSPALGLKPHDGCPACEDISPLLCTRFRKSCNGTPYYNRRKFMTHCHKTCGQCDCEDIKDINYCEHYKSQGQCMEPYMKGVCKRTCDLCGVENQRK